MDHFLLIIIVLSLVAFVSICFSKPSEKENDATGDGVAVHSEENELVTEQETNLPA